MRYAIKDVFGERGCFSFGMNYDQLIRVMGGYGYGMRGDFSLMSMIDMYG